MATIVPTILTDDPQQYRAQMTAFNAFANRIQIDITDGKFVKTHTIPLDSVWWPKGKQADLHLMVTNPSEYVDLLTTLHPSLVILHAEAEEELLPVIQKLKQADIKVGIAFIKTTFPGKVENLIKIADHALIFAGELGQQGGNADMLQTEKAPLIRQLKNNIEIGWDGGANIENIRTIAHSDIDVINVGSAITQSAQPAETYKQLTEEAEKRGVRI